MPRKKKATSRKKTAPSAKATVAKKPTMSKSAFIRSLPASTPGAEVVKRAKAEGLKVSLNYVYAIRTRLNAKAKRKPKAVPAAAARKRGPGRLPKSASNGDGPPRARSATVGGIEAAIEAIVERKVQEMLKQRLGALFGK